MSFSVWRESVIGCVSLYVAGVIASAAGVGGGGLNLPILLVVFGWNYTECISLSLATVMGNYIAQTLLNFDRRHPGSPTRPLIYWDAVLVLLPAQLGGSNIGVLLASVLPTTVLLILAMSIVFYAGYRTVSKGVKYYRLETEQMNSLAVGAVYFRGVSPHDRQQTSINSNSNPLSESLVPFLSTSTGTATDMDNVSAASSSSSSSSPRLELPLTSLVVLLAVWLVYAALFVVSKSYVASCSTAFFAILATSYVPLVLTILWGISDISKKQNANPSAVLTGDLIFRKLSFLPPVLSFLIGILCSLLGIGGGELMGPLLLSLKVLPQVSSATTSLMSLLNSSLTVLHFAIVGNMQFECMAICFSIGLLSGFSGRAFALYMTARYKRPSMLIFCLAFVLFLSLCLLIYNIASEGRPDFNFHSFC